MPSMPSTSIAAALAATLLLGGCVALGWRFGPGFSLMDRPLDGSLFSGPPAVVHRGEEYFLTWTQGSYPYFFQPDYKAKDGRLVFALVATGSSGNCAGRHREMRIEGADNLHALQRGGAYWWEREPEPNGAFVPLKIVESPPSPPTTLSKASRRRPITGDREVVSSKRKRDLPNPSVSTLRSSAMSSRHDLCALPS